MTYPILHTPTATPSQRLAAAAHEALKRRIAGNARPDSPICCASALERTNRALPSLQWSSPPPAAYSDQPPLTITLMISHVFSTTPSAAPTIEDVLGVVAARYGISRADIISAQRTAAIVRARQVTMFLAKRLTPHTLPVIGQRLGVRDHTTVLYAVNKIDDLRLSDRALADDLDALAAELEKRFVCKCSWKRGEA